MPFLRLIVVCLVAAGCGPAPPASEAPPPGVPRLDVEELSVAQLQDGMAAGRYTARQLVEAYLDRIERLDRSGPALRSIIEINPDARSIADALDAERQAKGARGPLHGIPVLVKDNIDTGDRMMTTAGSLALEGSIAPRDAFVVQRLRAAGAVILGKTNLSEWANFRSTRSSSGWSARGGQVKNPYALDRSPCGSSSGSGTAIAASLAAVAVGTETDGSIVCPSAATALVGIKPTVGLVSRTGIIPISSSQDTAGPMARTVADAAALLTVMTGVDPEDPASGASAGRARDYTTALSADALKGARIGVARKHYFGYSEEADRVIEAAIHVLRERGAVIVDPADVETANQTDGCEMNVMLHEFKAGLNAYLSSLGPAVRVRSLTDLIAFNEREQAREMPYFRQELFLEAEKKGPLTSPDYRRARQTCRELAGPKGLDATLTRHRVEALVAPTISPPWPIDLINGDHYLGASSSAAAIAGYPNVTVPAGFTHGLPIGMSFIGTAWSEERLIALAFAFEQATRHRTPPGYEAGGIGGRD